MQHKSHIKFGTQVNNHVISDFMLMHVTRLIMLGTHAPFDMKCHLVSQKQMDQKYKTILKQN